MSVLVNFYPFTPFFFFFSFRIQKATDSLKTFHPSADPCFDEFVLDTSKEETLLKEMCFGGGITTLSRSV